MLKIDFGYNKLFTKLWIKKINGGFVYCSLKLCRNHLMSERYSFLLTTFSPSGKLVQIEYALKAVDGGAPYDITEAIECERFMKYHFVFSTIGLSTKVKNPIRC